MMRRLVISALALVGVMAFAASAPAVTLHLIAKEFDKPLPGGGTVKMWGFAQGSWACWNAGGGGNGTAAKAARMASSACTAPLASSPGPRLTVSPSETNVRIRVVNLLDSADGGENISLVIPGQPMPHHGRGNPGPTWTNGSVGKNAGDSGVRRVRSFGRETVVDGGRRQYRWNNGRDNNLRPGTYLYHSGTHPQLQVQMGLYGAITRDAAAGEAYAPPPSYATDYDNEVLVLYSEIDTVLHDSVTSGDYGPGLGTTSTFDYQPDYYLVNGEPFDTKAAATIPGPAVGERTLLRMLNAGFEIHIASLQGLRMQLIAEDGNPYPVARDEYSAILAPLKTKDAILTPAVEGTYALYDGMLNLSNTDGSVGGMLSFLQVGAGTLPPNSAPVAVDDPAYDVHENSILTIAAPGVLDNDSDPDGHPITAVMGAINVANGSLTLNPDGSFDYVPIPATPGVAYVDSFTYRASDGVLDSGSPEATVTISVTVGNNPPVADSQLVTTSEQEAVAITLTGSDLDSDPILYTVTGGGPTNGSLSGVAPVLTYTPDLGFAGSDSFTFRVTDVPYMADSLSDGVVDITVAANQAPIAHVDSASTPQNQGVNFSLTDNDSDPDGLIDVTTVEITKPASHGIVTVNGDGTVTYGPDDDYTGSDSFRYRVMDDDGEWSTNPNGGANTKVRVNINLP